MPDNDLPVGDLAAYALLHLDDRARSLRSPLHFFLAQLCLLAANQPMSPDALFAAMRRELPATDALTEDDVNKVVKIGVQTRTLVRADGTLELSAARRDQLLEAQHRLDEHRRAFEADVVGAVEVRLGRALGDEERTLFVNGVHEQTQQIFAEHTARLVHALGREGKGFDESLAGMSSKSLNRLADPLAAPNEKLTRSQVIAGIRDAFGELSEHSRAHLAAVYQRTVVFALLDQDPSIRRVKRALAQRRVLALDTNVIIAWWFPSDLQHEEARALIETARSIGCKLVVTRYTQEELSRWLAASADAYRRFGHDPALLAVMDDPVLRDYAERRNKQPNLAFSAFMAGYNPPGPLLAQDGFDIDDKMYASTQHDNRVPAAVAAVSGVRKASQRVIEVDAKNLIQVQLLRRQHAADEMGSAVWLATTDRSLARAETELLRRRIYRVPSSREIKELVEFLSPHATPEEHGLQEYVTYLLRSRLGLISEDPVFIDIRFLETLRAARFDIDGVLASTPERARQILTSLQEDNEVRRLLQEGRPEDDGREWEAELGIAVERALAKIEDSPERRALLDRLRQEHAASVKRAEAAEVKARIAEEKAGHAERRALELERQLAHLRDVVDGGLRGRIRAWFARTFG